MLAPKSRWLLPTLFLTVLVSCFPVAPRVVRIGFVAPFEGRYREMGQALIPAARLAIREWAADHPDAPIAIELVAYDDGGDPAMAVTQAQKLVVDSDVLIVIGHWRDEATQAALSTYREAGIPLVLYSPADVEGEHIVNLSPSLTDLETSAEVADVHSILDLSDDITELAETLQQQIAEGPVVGGPLWGLTQFYALAGPAAEGVYFVTGAALPSDLDVEGESIFVHPLAPLGYDSTLVALNAIQSTANPTRETVAVALPSVQVEGVTGSISFDENRRRVDPPVYLYIWQDGQRHLVGDQNE